MKMATVYSATGSSKKGAPFLIRRMSFEADKKRFFMVKGLLKSALNLGINLPKIRQIKTDFIAFL